jgi:hypothetical protein
VDPHRAARKLPVAWGAGPVTGQPPPGKPIKMDVPRPLRDRIGVIRDGLHAETGRYVTLPETLEELVKFWETGHQA